MSTFRSACLATSGRPRASERPRITGAPYVGGRLEGSRGDWCGKHPIQLHFRWNRCRRSGCSPIVGATRSSYVPGRRDVGKTVVFSVTAMSPSGTRTVKSNGKRIGRARLTSSSPPTVSGTAQAGLVLTTSTGTWTGSQPVAYGYQWLRCDSTGSGCAAAEGEVTSNYRLVAGDVGSTFRARVTATNASGSKSATSAPTDVVSASSAGTPPLNTAPPTVAGTATEGLTLTASAGVWAGTTPIAYGYQWRRCDSTGSSCTDVSGRTAATYVLGAEDVGKTLRISVSGANDFGVDAATSVSTPVVARAPVPPANTSLPTISGNAVVGSALHADLGTWAGSTPMTFSYQWRRCDGSGGSCVSIAGATHGDYSVVDADAGGSLRVLVTAANSIGSAASQSSASRVVPKSSVYWGAYMDGDPTYTYYYGGSWGDAPWDSNTWSKFESNAGKQVSIVHWGSGSSLDTRLQILPGHVRASTSGGRSQLREHDDCVRPAARHRSGQVRLLSPDVGSAGRRVGSPILPPPRYRDERAVGALRPWSQWKHSRRFRLHVAALA